MSSCLFECLKEAGLERYYSTLQRNGYKTAFSLLYVSTAELQDVGITTDSDRQRFLQLVQIIASFHQGGELSPRRCHSPRRHAKAKSMVKHKREMRTSSVLDFQSSTDSGTTSEESPTGYVLSPRRKLRNSAHVNDEASNYTSIKDKNMPTQRGRDHSSGITQNTAIRRTDSSKENYPGTSDNNNNAVALENVGRVFTDLASLSEDSDEIASATRNIRNSAESLKVQKVMRTKGYNYGLPRDGHKQNGVSGLTPKMHRRTPAQSFTPRSISLNSRDSVGSPKEQGRITVCVRKRPILPRECESQCFDIVTCNREDGGKEGGLVVHELKHTVDMSEFVQQNVFQFDKVFAEHTTNKDVYEGAVKSMVDWVMTHNHRATCFGYGQTGAGKTHTLLGDDTEAGVFFHAAQDVLVRVNEQNARTNREKRRCSLSVSLYEIYCSRIFDLLNDHKRLQALEDSNKQIHINGLRAVQVNNMQALEQVVRQGLGTRSVGVTGANQDSSRSHAIVQLSLRDANNTEYSRLSFIDLAGSERACDALRDSDKQNRLEGAEINQSLLALKECIRSLDLALAHTPFRQSKLTQVLRDSFIGNSKTCMIANISPAHASLEHTMNTLRYASRVKELHRKPIFSTPRQRHRSKINSSQSASRRPVTADPSVSNSRLNHYAASPHTPSNLSRSVSIDSGTRVEKYSAFSGRGRELSRTPPLISNSNVLDKPQQCQMTLQSSHLHNRSTILTENQQTTPNISNDLKSISVVKNSSIFTSEAIGASSTPHKSTEKVEYSQTALRNILTEPTTNDTTILNKSPESTPRFLNDTEPVGGAVGNIDADRKNIINPQSSDTDGVRSSITDCKSSESYSNTSSIDAEHGSSKRLTISKTSDSNSNSNYVNDNAEASNFTSKDLSDNTKSRTNEKTSSESNVPATNANEVALAPLIPESRKNPGLPSPQKFLSYFKGKNNVKKKALKQQLRKASRRDANTLDDEGHNSDHSGSSSTRSANTRSSSSTRRSSLITEVQQQLSSQLEGVSLPQPVVTTNTPSPPGLPSPKLDSSRPRRSSRVLHSSRSSSPGSGGRTTPDERNSIASTSSNPATTTGLTSASELHARLAAAAASNRQSDSDNVKSTESEMPLHTSTKYKSITEASRIYTSSDKEDASRKTKQDELVHRAQSEVIIAHQEHISEILRISIEEERLYHELRDQWGKGTSFGTYTKSLQSLLAKKTQSIDALKLQLALYERVRSTSV